MLSRVADSLFWLSRNIERAENLARLIDVNFQESLEAYRATEVGRSDPWRAVLYACSAETEYEEAREMHQYPLQVEEFIAMEPAYPDSIRNCIANARENARMVRDQISEEMWLELNTVHLYLQSDGAMQLWRSEPEAFFRKIVDFSLLYQGLSDATILHNEGWLFVQMGRFLERADKTSRILDMLTFESKPDRVQMSAVLRSCSAFSAFREEFRGEVTLENVASFLLFSESFPRSARFCVRRLDEMLHAISGFSFGGYSNEPERLAGSLMAQLNFTGPGEVQERGLHAYIDDLQGRLNEIGQSIFETYVLLPSEIEPAARSETVQMQWQHQQQ